MAAEKCWMMVSVVDERSCPGHGPCVGSRESEENSGGNRSETLGMKANRPKKV